MGKSSQMKFYAVAVGRQTGVFETWDQCQAQVNGFSGAKFKSFQTREEAQSFVDTISTLAESTKNNAAGSKKRPRSGDDNQEDETRKTKSSKTPIQPRPQPTKYVCVQIHVMFDGGSRGNPGVAGAGAIITCQQTPLQTIAASSFTTSRAGSSSTSGGVTKVWQNRRVTKIRDYLGVGHTNNQAEYQGLCVGLKQAADDLHRVVSHIISPKKKNSSGETNEDDVIAFRVECIVQGDSQLIINQVTGDYQCHHEKLKPYLTRVKNYLDLMETAVSHDNNDRCQVFVNTRFEHVLREFNAEADALGNEAMDARQSWTTVTVDGVEQPPELT
ncbi:hypothetical protein ACA910_021305 [Epithemia clementina (nom. ined.)]